MLITQKTKKKPSKYVHLRLSEEILDELKKNAEKYTEGNLSAWLKYAGIHCVPDKKHIVKNKK